MLFKNCIRYALMILTFYIASLRSYQLNFKMADWFKSVGMSMIVVEF